MKKKMIPLFVIFAVVLLIASFNSYSQNHLAGIDLPLNQMNNDLTLDAPPELSVFERGKDLGLVLMNHAKTPITLPADYGVHVYQLIDNKWKPIENWMDFGNDEKIIFPISEGPVIIAVLPDIEMDDQPITVRVVVVGNYLLDNGVAGDEVGAYVDIPLQP